MTRRILEFMWYYFWLNVFFCKMRYPGKGLTKEEIFWNFGLNVLNFTSELKWTLLDLFCWRYVRKVGLSLHSNILFVKLSVAIARKFSLLPFLRSVYLWTYSTPYDVRWNFCLTSMDDLSKHQSYKITSKKWKKNDVFRWYDKKKLPSFSFKFDSDLLFNK